MDAVDMMKGGGRVLGEGLGHGVVCVLLVSTNV